MFNLRRRQTEADTLTLHTGPVRQAFLLLRTVFTLAPMVFGLDKFTNLLADWTLYLAPVATSVIPLPAQTRHRCLPDDSRDSLQRRREPSGPARSLFP